MAVMVQWWAILVIVLLIELGFTFHYGLVLHSSVPANDQTDWLVRLTSGIFLACFITVLLSLVAIFFHLRAALADARQDRSKWHRGIEWLLPFQRDVAIQVLLMPAVYHLMMCRTVLRQWSKIARVHIDIDQLLMQGFDANKALEVTSDLQSSASEANIALAEMYDAYALLCFGMLAMQVVRHELGQSDVPLRNLQQEYQIEEKYVDLREKHEQRHGRILGVLDKTLLVGVQMYTLCTFMSALYSIGLTAYRFAYDPLYCSKLAAHHDSGMCLFSEIIYGANFATSSIAIWNLIVLERSLHQDIADIFSPTMKFWSMKIPVTLAFSIGFLKPFQPLTGMSSARVDVLNAATKAYCMTLVALLNIFAWDASEAWYSWVELRDDLPDGSLKDEEQDKSTSSDE
eukprot:TRINITY_DN74327_c0_g1_i1.p1 TRINITY_DN74327_c0_g1~~TRINITY_DN74327_c0_g1_i1.p1  ORF type:complete len:414 (-),score=64.71 TRINITY_DN74327_c0_g1_i1:51-1253(-)